MTAGLVPSADSPALIITSEPEAAALTAKQHKDLLGLQSGMVAQPHVTFTATCAHCHNTRKCTTHNSP
jgi:hypothetical protein